MAALLPPLLLMVHITLLQVKTILDEVLEKLPEEYNMSDITSKTAERSPYILVCFQECERMNMLIAEIRRSLKELDLGLKVKSPSHFPNSGISRNFKALFRLCF